MVKTQKQWLQQRDALAWVAGEKGQRWKEKRCHDAKERDRWRDGEREKEGGREMEMEMERRDGEGGHGKATSARERCGTRRIVRTGRKGYVGRLVTSSVRWL